MPRYTAKKGSVFIVIRAVLKERAILQRSVIPGHHNLVFGE